MIVLLAAESLDPGWDGLAAASVLMLATLGAAYAQGVHMIRQGLWAAARASVQLIVIGLVLGYVFALEQWYGVAAVLLVMAAAAGFTGSRRLDRALRRTGPLFSLVLAAVTAVTLVWVTQMAVGVHEIRAQYFVPLGGMILGNAMTAGTLAAGRYADELRSKREPVEAALSLGASPAQATRESFRMAFAASITPTMNTMLIVGIVKLPGIMTGQMLAGADPFLAAKYQLVVLFMLLFGDGMTALLVLWMVRRRAFTRAWQPRL